MNRYGGNEREKDKAVTNLIVRIETLERALTALQVWAVVLGLTAGVQAVIIGKLWMWN